MKTTEEIFKAFYNFCKAVGSLPHEMRIYYSVGSAESVINIDFISDWQREDGSHLIVNDYTGVRFIQSSKESEKNG